MPIYEFYCPDCHTVFNFFSRRVDTEKRPDCPRCDRPRLERRVSLVSVIKGGRQGGETEEGMPDPDDAQVERAMTAMAAELERVDQNDPRAMGRAMRRLMDAAGLQPRSGMEEALSRLERGEDPDRIEAEMGEVLDADPPFDLAGGTKHGPSASRVHPPKLDETLYEL